MSSSHKDASPASHNFETSVERDATHDEISTTSIEPPKKYIFDFDGNTMPLLDRRPIKRPIARSDYFFSFAISTSKSRGTLYPMHDYLTYKRLSTSHTNFVDKVSTSVEPSSHQQAN